MQIISKITSTSNLNRYKPGDEKLFSSFYINEVFGKDNDYVEYHVYDVNGNLLNSDYNFKNYKPSSFDKINIDGTIKTIELDPGQDLINLGYSFGDFISEYNFFRKRFSNNINDVFFIREISSDRTEIKVGTNNISNSILETEVNNIINEITSTPYYKDYILNFGNNQCVVAINIALDKSTNSYNILFKLYEPLPLNINVKDIFWVVEEIIQPPIFEIDLANYINSQKPLFLKGPNFDINVEDKHNSSIDYNSYNSLLSTSSFSNSYQQIFNLINTKEIEINVDYNNFENFIHFSSITERLENFKYKLQLIETYQSQSLTLDTYLSSSNTFVVKDSKNIYQNKIDNIISNFDGYEYFLYFESGSNSWPKKNNEKPYINYETTSSIAINWFNNQIISGSLYDENNQDNLEYSVSEFIRNDSQNASYLLFLNMIGQHFDNIWIFIKSITDINRADNKIDEGISKDLIKNTLTSLGIKIYNSNSNINIFDYLIGANEDNFKYKYNENTGSYYTTVISGSNETLPKDDLNKEILKRIYHNLPYLLKSKGTSRGLRALINCFGIPDTILRINEFGSYNENEVSYNVNYNRFSYCLYLSGSGSVKVPWENLTVTNSKPQSIEFRFKFNSGSQLPPTQSLIKIGNNFEFSIYTNSGSSTGFPVWKTNTGIFRQDNDSYPFGNGNWWNVLISNNTNGVSIYWASKFEGRNEIEYLSSNDFISSSYPGDNNYYLTGSTTASFGNSGSIYLQDIRYWSEILYKNTFKKHVLNPESYVGENTTSSYYTLNYRLPLGINLITNNYSSSYHPNLNISPFAIGTQIANIISGSLVQNEEKSYSNNFIGGFSKNNDKININNYQKIIDESSLNYGVLSYYNKLEQVSSSLSPDLHFVEVSFSPTNEINNDIKNELGDFYIDNYIGDPQYLYSESYDRLFNLNKEYFKKYTKSYNYYDYIRLIKFFDNSLFRMIKDFIPARSNAITGISIESPILERNKIKNVPPSFNQQIINDAVYDSGSITDDNSYFYNKLQGDKKPFYNGEVEGSILNIYKYFTGSNYNPYLVQKQNQNLNDFIHSDFNILLNNVSSSVTSLVKRKIDNSIISSSIEYKAELQDYYEDLYSFQYSRYNGSKLTSQTYNTYITGDISYGKTAVIDKNVKQIGLFTEIVSSSFLPYRNNVTLKYLVDESGSLTELNQRNKHWEDVQRTFIAGNYLNVSLFDNQKYGNQKTLDGNKTIFNSGYSYYPILYYSSSDSRLYFQYTGMSISKLFRATNINGGYISGSNTILYPSINGNIYNIFDQLDPSFSDGNINYTIGDSSLQTFPTYIVPEAGNYKFSTNFNLNLSFTSSLQSGSYTFKIKKNGNIIASQTKNFTSSYALSNSSLTSKTYYKNNSGDDPAIFRYKTPIPIDLYRDGIYVTTISSGSYLHIFTGSLDACTCGNLCRDRAYLFATSSNGVYTETPNLPGVTVGSQSTCFPSVTSYYMLGTWVYSQSPFTDTDIEDNLSSTFNFNLNSAYDSYTVGDQVTFEFTQNLISTTNYTASVSEGELKNQLQTNQQGNNPYVENTIPFISGSVNGDTFVLSSGLSGLLDYLYLPSTGSNSLYSTYGDVDYIFSPKLGDILLIKYGGGVETQEFTIEEVYSSGSQTYLRLSPDLPSTLNLSSYTISSIDLCLILTKVDDETNIILNFNKRPGKTTYGFIIPENIHPNFLNNIDVITKEVKQKLLNEIGILGTSS